jgi:DNA-binding NtrC family response regulator
VQDAPSSTPKNNHADAVPTGNKVLVFEPSEHYLTLYSDLAPAYFDSVIHCETRQQLLQGALEHSDARQIIVSLHDGTKNELGFLEQLHEACPKAKILLTAEPRTIRTLVHLKSQAAYVTVLSKPFSIKRLANTFVAKH